MRRPGTAQLELPLLGAPPVAPAIPDLAGDPRPATACVRCGWYIERPTPCPACGEATSATSATSTTSAGPRLPPLRRVRRESHP